MKKYRFDLELDSDISDAQLNELFETGLDDGSFIDGTNGTVIALEREAESYDEAIKTALTQVENTIPVFVENVIFHTKERALV